MGDISRPLTTRLAAAGHRMQLSGDGRDSGQTDRFRADPLDVFEDSLLSLRDRALQSGEWSTEELASFANELALLIAGLRQSIQSPKNQVPHRRTCDDLLARCEESDPETDVPRLDCFMVYAECLLRHCQTVGGLVANGPIDDEGGPGG